MSQNEKSKTVKSMSPTAFGMVTGLVFGGLIGTLIGQPVVFSGGCMVLGLAIGRLYEKREKS